MMKSKMFAAGLVAALVAVGCTTVAVEDDVPEVEDEAIHVSLFEFEITEFDVQDGEEITLVVTNDGYVAHELRFVMPGDIEGHEHDEHGDMADAAPVIALDPGETGTLTFTYDAMYFQAVCLLPGHYEAGMFLQFSEPMADMDEHAEEAEEGDHGDEEEDEHADMDMDADEHDEEEVEEEDHSEHDDH